jgi:hypothetical protein
MCHADNALHLEAKVLILGGIRVMTMQTRRRFLATAALTAAALRLDAQTGSPVHATLVLSASATGAQMPEDFLGLSYEIQQLTSPDFFSPANTSLVRAFRELSLHGVLRLGGNTSEFGYWKPTPTSSEPEHPKIREAKGEPKAQYYPVPPEAIENLAAFLEATGWTCIYGIGMGTNTPERSAEEAAFVAKTLGPRLKFFQIGNEVDLFGRHLRDPNTWSPKTYLDEWLTLARAIVARVPDARFGLPDVADKIEWLPAIADLWLAIENPPHVITLSHHYYFGGPASNPDVTIANLLKSGARVQRMADTATLAARKMGLSLRLTEGNTCYRGGKPGVSDVFGAALWSADYALQLAANGYSGVNLHGGTGKSVANSVGGFLPGDVLLKEQGATNAEIATHPHPFYTPIGTFDGEYKLQPVAYGLKFAAEFSGATLLKTDLTAALQAAGVNATAYAARFDDGRLSLIVLNKDAEKDLALAVDFGSSKALRASVETLTAPALESRKARLEADKRPLAIHGGKLHIVVPHASGLRLTQR